MRDRLIELMRDCCDFAHCLGMKDLSICINQCSRVSKIADHLLAHGVIVPKCKIGDKLYEISVRKNKIYEATITLLKVDKDHTEIWGKLPYENAPHYICNEVSLGYNEWVYLTREEAEKALAKRSENGK